VTSDLEPIAEHLDEAKEAILDFFVGDDDDDDGDPMDASAVSAGAGVGGSAKPPTPEITATEQAHLDGLIGKPEPMQLLDHLSLKLEPDLQRNVDELGFDPVTDSGPEPDFSQPLPSPEMEAQANANREVLLLKRDRSESPASLRESLAFCSVLCHRGIEFSHPALFDNYGCGKVSAKVDWPKKREFDPLKSDLKSVAYSFAVVAVCGALQ